jgi:NitT/TauT family transport system ATP-binding protein
VSFVSMQGVSYTFAGWPPVVRGVDWEVGEGEFHCLVGRSGCGKTTLLKLAAGLLRPDEGRITFADRELVAPGPKLGFVFQSPTLLEWHRVLDNVLLPVSLQHRPTAREVDKAQQLLAQLGLSAHAAHYPRQLSGGQQSRVALARALILEPALLLMDEPFAALDAITREELQDDLLHMCRLRRTTVLFVTHDISEAVYLADRIAVMDGGTIVEEIHVDMPRPRGPDARTSAVMTRHCAQVRHAMHMGEAVAA